MGAIAAARTTESSPLDFATSTHTPGLFVLDGFYNPAAGLNGYNAKLLRTDRPPPPRGEGRVRGGDQRGPRREERRAAPGQRRHRRQRQRGRTELRRGPRHRDPGADGQPEEGQRVRDGLGNGARLRATSGRDGDESAGSATPRGTTRIHFKVPRTQQIKMKLVGVGAIDAERPVPGPGRGRQQSDRALHARIHPQTPRLLRQRHAQRDHAPGWAAEPATSRRSSPSSAPSCPRVCPSPTSRRPTSWRGRSGRSSRSRSPWASSVGSPAWPRSSSPAR